MGYFSGVIVVVMAVVMVVEVIFEIVVLSIRSQ